LRILLYHAIGSPALGDAHGLFSIRRDLFERQMDHLSAHYGVAVVGLDPDLHIESKTQIAISFDDGYQDNLNVAAPILISRGLPFTVFVTSDFVRNGRPGFLTPTALRELAAMPKARIGAHGATHVALSECDDPHLLEELRSSKQYLEDTIGREVLTMAYPYGAADRRVRAAVLAAGYRLAASSYANINDAARDRLVLGRTEVLGGDSLRVFRQKLHGDWDWRRWRTKDPACL
jgi:peptidoglycan/xylan/chitin deacetylase (PgdA/CDA1 family)